MYKKGVVVVVICLFIGASVASSISSDNKQLNIGQKEKNINFVGPNSGIKMYKFYPTDDAYIDEEEPNSKHGGDEPYDYMLTRNAYGQPGSDNNQMDVLVKFDISSIPKDEEILSASLNLDYYFGKNNPAERDLNLYKITSNWFEDTVTWDKQPSYVSDPTSFETVPNEYGCMTWDVTSDVRDFVNKSVDNYGWKITDQTYYGSDNIPTTYFRTKGHEEHIPYLEIKILPTADIYIDDNGPNDPGPNDKSISDPLENGSKEHPFDEIQEGIDNASDDNTVFVHNGKYDENLLINKSINLIGECRNGTAVYGVVNIKSNDLNIEGFKLEGGCIEILKLNNIAFYNNTFLCTNSYNFNISYCNETTIKNCNIFGTGKEIANIRLDATKNVLIDNNYFSNSNVSDCAIQLYYSENDTLSNNTFDGTYKNLTYVESSKFCNILENNFAVYKKFNYTNDNNNMIHSLINLEGCNSNNIIDNILIYNYSMDTEEECQEYNINFFIRLKNSNDNYLLNNSIIGGEKPTIRKGTGFFLKYILGNADQLINRVLNKLNPDNNNSIPRYEGYGIRIVSSNGNIIKNNNITGVKVGISISQSKGNYVVDNNIESCWQFGIHLARTTWDLFVYNNLQNNYISVNIEHSYRDWLWLNNFVPCDGAPEFQFVSPITAGSYVWAQFNYWDNPFPGPFPIKVWGVPFVFFVPYLPDRFDKCPARSRIAEYILKTFSPWSEERDIYEKFT